MALEDSKELGLVDVPNLNDSTVRANGEMLPSLGPTHRGHLVAWAKVMQLRHLAVACRPDVDAVGETDCQVVGRRPVDQVQVEIVLESWRIKNFVGNLGDLA